MEISFEQFKDTLERLERGEVRVAEKIDGKWVVNTWVKQTILAGFGYG